MFDERKGLPVFDAFPEIAELGHTKVHNLCQQFLQTAVSREFAVSELSAFDTEGGLLMTFRVDLSHAVKDGDHYYFPIDQLLRYIVDNGVSSEKRERLKARIGSARQRRGPHVFRRFRIQLGPKVPLFLTCKNSNCGNIMMTQFRVHRSERGQWGPTPVECPRCRETHEYDQEDLHFGPNEGSYTDRKRESSG